MNVAYVSHADCGRHDTGWKHPEHVGRLRAISRALRNDPDLFANLVHHEGRHASQEELAISHEPEYVERVREMAEGGGGQLDPDTVISEGSWDAATAAAGCLLDAVDMAFDGRATRAYCAVRPPGHHALRARGMGFCLFGNVALAARYARVRSLADRILIVDWDVHHGNGTQALVQAERDIRFISLHQWPWYPGTGRADERGPFANVWNIPMAAGLRAGEYAEALVRAIDAATTDFRPDLVLVSCGFDSLRGDPLGGFTFELADMEMLTRELVTRAEGWCGGRMIVALEGGYDPDRVGEGSVAIMRSLL
ncbi:MAG: Histone deacetylase-like amidohydrolase [Gemmatimonadaceae bacterium]|nr:Histone deacetylase-like amidohydrolase [Gemmatimonadaceae bacterium]